MLLLWPSAHIFDDDDENNDDDDDDDDDDEKKGANEAPTSFPPNKLVGAEKHLWPSDRPDPTAMSHKYKAKILIVHIQREDTKKYKYKMNEVNKLL